MYGAIRGVAPAWMLVAVLSAPGTGLAQETGVQPPQEEAGTGAATSVVVVSDVARHPGANLVWIPHLARWQAREFVCAYGVGIPGKGDMGDIVSVRSGNDGRTWSEPIPIFDHRQTWVTLRFAYANPVLFSPPGQRVVWCFAMRCPLTNRHSEDSQLAAAYTADGGRSWNAVELAMHYSGPLIIVGSIRAVPMQGEAVNGGPAAGGSYRYLLPVHRNTRRSDPFGSREQFVLESTSLLEWRLPREGAEVDGHPAGFVPQPPAPDGPIFLHEGQIAEGDAAGEWKMVMRTSRWKPEGQPLDPPRAWSTVSRDGGTTWSVARQEPDLFNAVSKAAYEAYRLPSHPADGPAAHVYVYNDTRDRRALRFKRQSPDGTWGAEQTFYDADGIHNSYPTLLETAPGEFACVWDSGTKDRHRTSIKFGRLKLVP